MSKTILVRNAIIRGDKKNALKMASDFRGGVTPDQRRVLKTGYECINFPEMYRQMKVDPEKAIDAAWTLLQQIPAITGVKA